MKSVLVSKHLSQTLALGAVAALFATAAPAQMKSSAEDRADNRTQMQSGMDGSMAKMGEQGCSPEMIHDRMMQSLKSAKGAEFDQAFIDRMIKHHQEAIDMAQLAKKNAQNNDLKTFADNTIAQENADIQKLKNWQRNEGAMSNGQNGQMRDEQKQNKQY